MVNRKEHADKMEILKKLQKYSDSPRKAVVSGDISLTYKLLWEKSEIISAHIKNIQGQTVRKPALI